MKRITFITTGQPSSNPRLVKEVETLIKAGYHVKVIYCFYHTWAEKFDQEFIDSNPEVYICCGGDPQNSQVEYLVSRLRQKLFNLFLRLTKRFGVAENAINRTHSKVLSRAKGIESDLYIAHNLGALPAAVCAAKYNNAKVGYDAEDMHSGQFEQMTEQYYLNRYIEEKYFSQTDYFTAASPLIAKNYKRLYDYLKPEVINNVFPKVNLSATRIREHNFPIKLFWFSQTIGRNRGLEDVIKSLQAFDKNQFELHLLGDINLDERKFLTEGIMTDDININFHSPISPNELLRFTTQFDIGLSLENKIPLNRDICLTNKLFSYIQAGLAVVASDTQAQKLFFERYPTVGKLYVKNDQKSLKEILTYYIENYDDLLTTKQANFILGQSELNWEKESEKFLKIIEQTLS